VSQAVEREAAVPGGAFEFSAEQLRKVDDALHDFARTAIATQKITDSTKAWEALRACTRAIEGVITSAHRPPQPGVVTEEDDPGVDTRGFAEVPHGFKQRPHPAAETAPAFEPDPELTDAENEGLRLGTHYIAADCSVRLKPSAAETAPDAGLVEALRDILNPVGALQREADATGSQLNDRAYSIANSVSFLQDIARAALSRAGEPKAPHAGLVEALEEVTNELEGMIDMESDARAYLIERARAALSRAGERHDH
jgi:hypothetical protein